MERNAFPHKMQATPMPTLRACKEHAVCAVQGKRQLFFERRGSEISGDLCFPCITKTFAGFELTTLLFTWWGIIGAILGPIYLIANIVDYTSACLAFAFKR
jgi:hypothetical protein